MCSVLCFAISTAKIQKKMEILLVLAENIYYYTMKVKFF